MVYVCVIPRRARLPSATTIAFFMFIWLVVDRSRIKRATETENLFWLRERHADQFFQMGDAGVWILTLLAQILDVLLSNVVQELPLLSLGEVNDGSLVVFFGEGRFFPLCGRLRQIVAGHPRSAIVLRDISMDGVRLHQAPFGFLVFSPAEFDLGKAV